MDESMEIKVAQMIKFDAEDMLPAEYKHRVREEKQPSESSWLLESEISSRLDERIISKIDPQEWIKAPVFIPRQIPATNGFTNPFEVTPSSSYFHDKHLLPNLSTIPPDSKANYLTSFNPSQVQAPPSTSIILRKKRRLPSPKRLGNRRHRLDSLALEPMAGGGRETQTHFLRLQSPIVKTSVNILGNQAMWSSTADGYSLKRLSRSPSLLDLYGQDSKSTASETKMKKLQNPSIYPNSQLTNQLDSSSCPDLSDNQLQLWDNILSSVVQQEKYMKKLLDNNSNIVQEDEQEMDSAAFEKMTASTVMNTSVYELCSPAMFDAMDRTIHPISNKELRRLDNNMAGCSLENSFNQNTMVDRLQQFPADKMTVYSNPANVSLNQTLASQTLNSNNQQKLKIDSESNEDVLFKPEITQCGYPKLNNAKVFITTFDPKAKKTMSGMDSINKCFDTANNDTVKMEQLDSFEGMKIQVNAFGECGDVALSEAECPSPSRLQQLQWAVQRHKNQYFETKMQNGMMGVDRPPDRVCCEIM